MKKKTFEYIGKRVPRADAMRQLSGSCRYADDLYEPGMLYARARYSDYAFAEILSVDCADALRMPGVRAIITAKDVPCNRYGTGPFPDQPVLADTRVLYRGDAIAVVAAETSLQAEAAARKIRVSYAPLKPVLTVEEALQPDAPILHPERGSNTAYATHMHIGDPKGAFERADYIIEACYRTQKVDHTPIEPRSALAVPTPEGGVHVITTSSRVFNFLYPMTQILKMPSSRVRLSVPEGLGGSFGGKNDLLPEPWVALLSLKTGRPVKMTFSREEDMNTSTIRHAYEIRHRTAVRRDGTILANETTMVADTGAYYAIGIAQLLKAAVHCCGPYAVQNQSVDAKLVFTNTLNASAMRGMGVPQSCFAWESHLDEIAARIGMDPIALRRKNLLHEQGKLVNGQIIDSAPARAAFELALKRYHETPDLPQVEHKKRGVGVACMIYPHDASGPSSATAFVVKVDGDGSAVIYNGLSDVGQGSKTALTQLAAEILGIAPDRITFVNGDTRMTPYDEGTGASRTVFICGRCLMEACEKARTQLFEAAGRELGVPDPRKMEIRDGNVCVKTFPELQMPVSRAAFLAERIFGHPIVATADFSTYSRNMDSEDGHALLFERHTYGAQIAEIDVDTVTGEIDVRKIVAVHSCGTVLNPMFVEGQIYGGVQMGLGYALMEKMDEYPDGSVATNTFSEYHIPTAADMPEIFVADMVDLPVEDGPMGAGGMSEGAPSPTAAAINNALRNATGVSFFELPLTPERVLLTINGRKTHDTDRHG